MTSFEALAIAFDVGTTTIAGSVLSLDTGERLAAAGRLNPQRKYGADVVSRMGVALHSSDDAISMTRLINSELERLTIELCHNASVDPKDIVTIAAAGNSVIEHLLLGLPLKSLAFPPYRPVTPLGRTLRTAELGWSLDVPCRIFPMPGGYVGGDLVAFLFGERAEKPCEPCLYLDLGTNGEIALAAGGKIFATSAAAGPAFEAGNLACGMLASSGAIDGILLDRGKPKLSVIGGTVPVGICGSGAIAVVSAMLKNGLVDHTGRLMAPAEVSSNLGNYVQDVNGQLAFVVYHDARSRIFISQDDIRQIQLAKSAICAGIEELLLRAGLKRTDLKQVVLTGSFGSVLSPQDLKNIGIFSENMVKICRFVQEGALRGVEAATLAADDYTSLDRLAEAIKVVPLSGTPAFEKNFFAYMDFPKSK